jgi:hypothetical protein
VDDEWPHPELDAARILETLGRHGVEFVVIGGLALALQGSNRLTFDLDVVPAADPANLDRLVEALRELGAKVIVYADTNEVHLSEPIWTATVVVDNPFLHLRTDAGDLDVLLHPTGLPEGYRQLRPGSIQILLRGQVVNVAGLDDIAISKRAVARAKDLEDLDRIERLRARATDP